MYLWVGCLRAENIWKKKQSFKLSLISNKGAHDICENMTEVLVEMRTFFEGPQIIHIGLKENRVLYLTSWNNTCKKRKDQLTIMKLWNA